MTSKNRKPKTQMSAKFPYIDVAVNVMENNEPSTMFLTDRAPAVQLPTLAGICSHFENLTDGYLLWQANDKRAYTYFLIDGNNTENTLTITLLIDADVLVSGRPVSNVLGAIKSRVLDGETLTSDAIDMMLTEAGFSEEPLRSECDALLLNSGAGVCCRTYAGTGELTNILGFPRQKDYERYRGVVIVSSDVMMVAGEELPHITGSVDKSLMVVCPEGVTASAQRVSFSDHLKVTYSCDGFDPVSVMFEVGTTNRYVRINGPALIVNNAHHAGIVFRRRIPYTVLTAAGTPIDTYTILINGRTASRTEEGFEVSNVDFENGEVKITVSSTNYSTYNQTFTPETLEESSPLAVVLEPESKEILLRLDFGNGRVVEERINIEKNTQEYCQLRAGRFHGFRAHRLMGSTPETYNVDVKPGQQTKPRVEQTLPLEPVEEPKRETVTALFEDQSDDKVATEEVKTDNGLKAPGFEKAPTAIWEIKKPEIKAPEFTNETRGEKEEQAPAPRNYKRIAFYSVCAIVLIMVIWGFSKCSGGSSEDEQLLTVDSIASVNTETGISQTPVTASPAAPTEAELSDITYLNENKVWKKDNLKSEMGIGLFNALSEGDVDAVVNNDYFAVKDRATNREAVKTIEMMWNAKGTGQSRAHSRVMKQMTEKGSLDVHKFYETIAKKMPKPEEYNQGTRPQR